MAVCEGEQGGSWPSTWGARHQFLIRKQGQQTQSQGAFPHQVPQNTRAPTHGFGSSQP